jgi:formate transporter
VADDLSPFDPLLPADMARRAEEAGVRKAQMDVPRLFVLAVLAGAFIALGGIFATTALAGTSALPWGPARVLGGAAFSLGLVLVVVGGAELFTGNALLVMAGASGRIAAAAVLRNWVIVYAGNFVGAVATAGLLAMAGTHRGGGGAFAATALAIAHAKLQLGFVQAVALGILCNGLVCLAVWLSYAGRSVTDRIAAVVLPITAFVAAGFEHSVANMYFVPFALFLEHVDPSMVAASVPPGGLAWSRFLLANLLPVTLGNLIGGVLLVGAVYWFVYPASAREVTAPRLARMRPARRRRLTQAPRGRCSARRFRFVNWRVCMIQCAGSQKPRSMILCRRRRREAA